MQYGNILSKRVSLQDSLLTIRSQLIQTLLDNNKRIHIQKDSLLHIVSIKDKEITEITNKCKEHKKRIRTKNVSIGFLIIITIFCILL